MRLLIRVDLPDPSMKTVDTGVIDFRMTLTNATDQEGVFDKQASTVVRIGDEDFSKIFMISSCRPEPNR